MKLFIMQFSAISRHFFFFGQNILLNTLFSNTLRLCPSFNVRDHVSHPYRIIGKLKFFYIVIFTFIDSRREDRSFWTEW
jgi:hypothetical protein